jgi:mono/diheme cytochrome c family protein
MRAGVHRGKAMLAPDSSGSLSVKRITVGVLLGVLASSSALPADIETGRRLAQQRCAACHIVTGSPRNDLVADAPPFLVIGRKYAFDAEAIALNLVGPHAKMNFALTRPEAIDVAAYIQSLAR